MEIQTEPKKKEIESLIRDIDFDQIKKHPNILIAARFWDDRRYHAAMVCYKFMRMIDDYIDDRKATGKEISCLEREELSTRVHHWIECLHGSAGEDPFFDELSETIATFRIPLQLFHNFAKSMLYDIDHDGFPTLESFLEYSEGASVAPASIFVHLCCLQENNGEYLDPLYDIIELARPCAIFSYLVHIIRDFQEDQLNNLNYFAGDILEKHGITPRELKEIALGNTIPDAFRKVVAEYLDQAMYYGIQTMEVLEKLNHVLSGRSLLSLHIIYQLYTMVFEKIDVAHGTFNREELNPTAHEIRERVQEVVLSWEG
ncbi:MAG: squalene/phytoene synthase family protein [Bacteroidales bacterium]